jgi:hypothetical protein
MPERLAQLRGAATKLLVKLNGCAAGMGRRVPRLSTCPGVCALGYYRDLNLSPPTQPGGFFYQPRSHGARIAASRRRLGGMIFRAAQHSQTSLKVGAVYPGDLSCGGDLAYSAASSRKTIAGSEGAS